MDATHLLAREHLLRAVAALEGDDERTEEIRYIISRTITLLEDHHTQTASRRTNVVEMSEYRRLRCAKALPA